MNPGLFLFEAFGDNNIAGKGGQWAEIQLHNHQEHVLFLIMILSPQSREKIPRKEKDAKKLVVSHLTVNGGFEGLTRRLIRVKHQVTGWSSIFDAGFIGMEAPKESQKRNLEAFFKKKVPQFSAIYSDSCEVSPSTLGSEIIPIPYSSIYLVPEARPLGVWNTSPRRICRTLED